MTAPDLAAAVAAHNRPFAGSAALRRLTMSQQHWPTPGTYDEAIAELQVTREELNDVMAEHENFGPLLRSACDANAQMAREFAELLTDRERIRDERDELAVRIDELRDEVEAVTDERNSARDEVERLKEQLTAAAGPAEVVLADGGTAVLG